MRLKKLLALGLVTVMAGMSCACSLGGNDKLSDS